MALAVVCHQRQGHLGDSVAVAGGGQVTGHCPGLRDTVPGQDLVHVTGSVTAPSDMEQLTDLGSTEAFSGRGQETGLAPAVRAGVGEQLGGGEEVGREAAGDQEDLEGAVVDDRELAALPGSPPRCSSHRRGSSEAGGVEAAPWM